MPNQNKQSQFYAVSTLYKYRVQQAIAILCVLGNILLVDTKLLISVGDGNMTMSSWKTVSHILNCWGSKDGRWRRLGPRLFKDIYPNDDQLVTKIYSACGKVENRVGINFHWVPSRKCRMPLPKFSPASMCKLMRGRKLIFLGDSLSIAHYETFVNAMQANRSYHYNNESHIYQERFTICQENGWGPSFEMYKIEYNSIAAMHKFYGDVLSVVFGKDPASASAVDAAPVIIANWGAFYNPDAVVSMYMKEFLAALDQHIPRALFMFRASNMAHAHCEKYHYPDRGNTVPQQNPQKPHWHWADFPLQNKIWSDYLLLNSSQAGKIYLNTFDMSSQRPDQHPGMLDCLHYCVPGPIDGWVQLTHGALFLVETHLIR
jgi:hypothetical protein